MISCLTSALCFGQAEPAPWKAYSIELGGSGGLGSFNFERPFYQKNKLELTGRVGLSFAPIDRNNGTGIVFPLMINCLSGQNAHKFEAGLGQGVTVTTKGSFFLLTTGAFGYRYQHPQKNLFWRVTYTPLVSYLIDFQYQHWGGISIGYQFNTEKG